MDFVVFGVECGGFDFFAIKGEEGLVAVAWGGVDGGYEVVNVA